MIEWLSHVVPLVGTWIEMIASPGSWFCEKSCPSWARGLKSAMSMETPGISVVPLVGTWIEILMCRWNCSPFDRRAPRGHVD